MFTTPNDGHYNMIPFPCKLHRMLEDSENLSFGHIVSWQPGGNSFKVNDPERFETLIMKEYFNQTQYKSFLKQLNIYGFKRIQTGPSKGAYIHKLFSKQSPELCERMERKRPNINARKSIYDCETITMVDPIKVSIADSLVPAVVRSKGLELHDSEVKTFYDFFFPQDPLEKEFISAALSDSCEGTGLTFDKATVDQDGMLDFPMDDIDFNSVLPSPEEEKALVGINDTTSDGLLKSSDEHNSFPWKLHLMLEKSKEENYQQIVSWVGDGSAFKVHNRKAFVEKIMPNYFDQTKYESFRRQLNLYGFTRKTHGADKGVISHPYLLEGARWLCGNITKKLKEDQ